MKLVELHSFCLRRLRRYGTPDYKFEAAQLFKAATGVEVAQLVLMDGGGREIRPAELRYIKNGLLRRRRGEPLQYILGEWEFFGLPLHVGPGVLIPRQDTELVAEVALECLALRDKPLIADLCSGSGAIAFALFYSLPGATVYAVEKSVKAHSYLCKNFCMLRERGLISTGPGHMHIVRGDVRCALVLPMLDLLISNPPYLTSAEMRQLQREVALEPRLALHGGPDGLRFYRTIINLQSHLIKDDGFIVFEVGASQGAAVVALLEEAGFADVTIRRDYAGHDRCVYARKPAGSHANFM